MFTIIDLLPSMQNQNLKRSQKLKNYQKSMFRNKQVAKIINLITLKIFDEFLT